MQIHLGVENDSGLSCGVISVLRCMGFLSLEDVENQVHSKSCPLAPGVSTMCLSCAVEAELLRVTEGIQPGGPSVISIEPFMQKVTLDFFIGKEL